jgi:hypothetical protein
MPDHEPVVDLIDESAASGGATGFNTLYLPLLSTIFFAGLVAITYFIFG